MAYQRKDYYYKKAKAEGKASRAAYKLLQLNERFRLVRKGMKTVDLGCAPGGWLIELCDLVGVSGRVIGIDLQPLKIPLPSQATFVQGSIDDTSMLGTIKEHLGNKAEVVVSDMAPKTSGVAFADAYRSYELATLALEACEILLIEEGSFIVKIFEGQEVQAYRKALQATFEKVVNVTPPATRKTSAETYFICSGYNKARNA